ncbi:cell division protein ZipA C-terminal FtsZ-binding domain-containing protein [Legionella sp. W05-934-2]|jgi:cell division protein ZipA|uniref:cell division protein ZipA C-terminal FtsZ-binding domain-containing protein n=1 Tax=Legionella sp. W05-934-2 TaxID=1198649 RepID=UPI0034618406
MQANISLAFNLLLLGGVIYAIFRILRKQPSSDIADTTSNHPKDIIERDDIIAIRKITPPETVVSMDKFHKEEPTSKMRKSDNPHQLYFLVPNKQPHFQGYDLLQSLLAAKLRFGEGNFFHYYQQQNGITESVFTVAATSETGQFDLNKMHAFTTRGLCLFIEPKADESSNKDAQAILLQTAKRLCQLLDATLLDETQKPMSHPMTNASTETASAT